jgi:hypothetical protein
VGLKILFVKDEDYNNYAFGLNPKTITSFLMELFKKNALTIEQVSKLIPLVAEGKYEDIIRSDEVSDVTLADDLKVLEVRQEWKEGCIRINL